MLLSPHFQSNKCKPTSSNAAGTASAVWNSATRTLTETDDGESVTAEELWSYANRTLTASPTDVSTLAKSAEITALQAHGDSTWATASGFATPADVTQTVDLSSVTSALSMITALLDNWSVSGNVLTVRNDDGSARKTYALTRDAEGEIIEIVETKGG